MKIYIGAIFMLLMLTTHAQQNCGVKGITTDPNNPINPEHPNRINTFNWKDDFYSMCIDRGGVEPYEAPFSQFTIYNLNLSHLRDPYVKDYTPENGWELLQFDFNATGNCARELVHMVMYNKYEGIIRVMVAGITGEPDAFDYARIEMIVEAMPNGNKPPINPTVILYPDNILPLDRYDQASSEFGSIAYDKMAAADVGENWVYADFNIAYDPCVCFYRSRIKFDVYFINNLQIDLAGTIEGTITDITSGSGSSEALGYANKAVESGTKAIKSFKTLKKFSDNAQKTIGTINKPDSELSDKQKKTKESLEKLPEFLTNIASSELVANGLKAIPYVGTALSVVNMFVAKEKKPQTMSINAQVSLSGTIADEGHQTGFQFSTPGSRDSELSQGLNYPLYNERLGVINLLNTPRVKVKRMTARWQSDMDWLEAQMTTHGYTYEKDYRLGANGFFNTGERVGFHRRYNLQLIDMPEIVINPAAGLKMNNPDIMVALVVKKEYKMLSEHGKWKDIVATFQGEMMPISCQKESFTSINFKADDVFRLWVEEYSKQPPLWFNQTVRIDDISQVFSKDEKFYLKIFANLERVDNGERVLHVVEYPLEIVPTSDFSGTPEITADDLHLVLENMVIKTNGSTDEYYQQTEALFVEYGANVVLDDKFTSDAEVNGYAGIHFKPGAHLERRQKKGFGTGNNAHFFTGGGAPCFSAPVNLANSKTDTFCSSGTYTANRIFKKPQGGNPVSIPGELETLRFELMPNPTNGMTTIRWSSSEIADQTVLVSVVDISGTEVVSRRVSVTDELMQFDLSDLSNGVYMVQLKTESGYTGIRKLVKQ